MNQPDQATLNAILAAIEPSRILRYLPPANQEVGLAFRYYLWNGKLSEAFQPSIHYAEILCRNAIHKALLYHVKDKWFENQTFLKILDPKYARQLADTLDEEREQHGEDVTGHHLVSSLTFGFWEHLTTKRFERLLWAKGIRFNFPGAPMGKHREDLRLLIEEVRRWRNRIAHHRAIFDKNPTRKHQDTLDLIQWVCPVTAQWVKSSSAVPTVINLRPSVVHDAPAQ